VDKNVPARPDLDHLRRQAKSLLANLKSGASDAAAVLLEYLPAAKGMTAKQFQAAGFRLADAQSAIARKSGFASWPHLARHVDQLRALEGTWSFAHLEVDGNTIPAGGLSASRILIDGDRFRTESPEATYEGVFNINVEAQPHEIDIEFVEGPEAGNRNFGIFRLDSDQLDICLDMNGKARPTDFRSSPGSGHAYEKLNRTSTDRPTNVAGGTAAERPQSKSIEDSAGFEFVDSPTLARLQGEWSAVKIVRDGQELPSMMLHTGRRSANKNEIKISFGGQTMIHALVRLDESTDPIHIDYYNLDRANKGTVQFGLLQWLGDEACFCMAAPGTPRPTDFNCPARSGRTVSQWRPKK
jgi:uncharacterized protein (TIGR03067 family)